MTSTQDNWLAVTGQLWKFRLGIGLLGVAVALIVAAALFRGVALPLFVAGAVLIALGTVWTFYGIRCPYCRAKVLMYSLGEIRWDARIMDAFTELRVCPACRRPLVQPAGR